MTDPISGTLLLDPEVIDDTKAGPSRPRPP
jgi:hypothetical protein